MDVKKLQISAWSLGIISVLLAIFAWGQGNSWKILGISTYQLFPLFGLLAFSLMWGHYVVAALRIYFKIDKSALKSYFEVTSLAVLGAILLHPGLLIWQLWRDGLGLPPKSEFSYVAPNLKGMVIIGTFSLMMFLAYELRRWYSDKSWWKLVQYASDLAILLIVVHGLKLGSQLQVGWYRVLWLFYSVTLLSSIAYIYYKKSRPKQL